MALKVHRFNGMCDGPIFVTPPTCIGARPEYCLFKGELRRCDEPCECAYISKLLKIIGDWPKDTGVSA